LCKAVRDQIDQNTNGLCGQKSENGNRLTRNWFAGTIALIIGNQLRDSTIASGAVYAK